MKKLFIILAILCGGISVNAQFTVVAESPVFKEDIDAMYRLVKMEDGRLLVIAVNVDLFIALKKSTEDKRLEMSVVWLKPQ